MDDNNGKRKNRRKGEEKVGERRKVGLGVGREGTKDCRKPRVFDLTIHELSTKIVGILNIINTLKMLP